MFQAEQVRGIDAAEPNPTGREHVTSAVRQTCSSCVEGSIYQKPQDKFPPNLRKWNGILKQNMQQMCFMLIKAK